MNRTTSFVIFGIIILLSPVAVYASQVENGLIPAFIIETDDLTLERAAQPNTPFDKVGRRFAILGYESGAFEAWAYPLKLLRNFEFSFFLGSSTQPIRARDIVRRITVTPAATTLTYAFQSFTVRATYLAAIDEPGAIILLDIFTTEPLTIACGFLPVLQPMWPAGIGGQYAYWDGKLKAYLISEPTRKNHGYLGSPAARGISYTPAHMLSDTPNEFTIVIDKPESVRGKIIPIVLAGGKGKREDIRQVYERLAADPERYYRAAVEHYKALRAGTLRVQTPSPKLNLAFEWAKVSYDNLLVDNPDLGRGLVAGLGVSGTGGRPGFGWFFGTDAYLNSLSLISCGVFTAAKDALSFTQKWQRADGKMAHELSQAAGYIDWFKDYPYGYIHGDTTPFYIVALHDFYRMTADEEFVRESWTSLRRAFDWCLTTDEDGDGLMDNKKAGLGALEFGALTGIKTDIYLAAVWVRACAAMESLASTAGDKTYVKKASENFKKALQALDAKFWDEESGQYAYAFNAGGELVKETSPWSAYALMWKMGESGRSARTLEKMQAADMTTDWGVRILSSRSNLYQPLNYNYGAVWPFLTGVVAAAQFKHNFNLQGFHSLGSNADHMFDNALGAATELFSGAQHIWPAEAVSHQGFSSGGVILPLVRGLLGLEGDAVERRVMFEPRFPADWREVAVENYRVGSESFAFRYSRDEGLVKIAVKTDNKIPYRISLAPALGIGTNVMGVRVNGQPQKFMVKESIQTAQPQVEFALTGNDLVEIVFEPTVEIIPPAIDSKVGDPDKGLKLISLRREGNQLKVTIEGLAGQFYALPLTQPKLVKTVSGAELQGDKILIQIPAGPAGEFLRHEISLKL